MRNRKCFRAIGTAFITAATLCISSTVAAAQPTPKLGDSWTDQAIYAPGSRVTVTTAVAGTGRVSYSLVHLGQTVESGEAYANGSGQTQWTFTAPSQDGTGYLVQADAGNSRSTTAVDISSSWTLFPRMGYLDSYPVGMSTDEQHQVLNDLARNYHLNALQYYDWMWRHEDPIEKTDSGQVSATWTDWIGNVISTDTVKGLISAGHEAGVAALPYSMSYAALAGYQSHGVDPSWRLFKRDNTGAWEYPMIEGQPDAVLSLMNPQNSSWQQHMVSKYQEQIDSFGFDGTHLDQLGNWGEAPDGGMNDASGSPADIPAGFAQLVDRTKDATGHPVGLNAVDGFGSNWLAQSSADYLYTELWENLATFPQLDAYLQRQRELSGGKPAVVAAYMNYKEPTGKRYEAEDGVLNGVSVAHNHSGYNGSGFVDDFGNQGDSVTVTVHVDKSRTYQLIAVYASNVGRDVYRNIAVDGQSVGTMSLSPTDSWDQWNYGGIDVALTAGDHKITISCANADCGYLNLDSIILGDGTFNTPSVQLASAAFAAMGATHIEIGQDEEMLVDPYFPNNTKQMDSELKSWMQSYYDVITGYENLFYGPTLRPANGQVELSDYPVSTNGAGGTIWAKDTRDDGMTTIHLINLLNNDDAWRNSATVAQTLHNVHVRYYLSGQAIPSEVKIASPDRNQGRAENLAFSSGTDSRGTYLDFTVPQLSNWDFIFFGQSSQGNGNVVTRAGKCLDVAGGSAASGTPVQLWDCASVPAQNWVYDGTALTAMGACLTLADDSGADGTQARIEPCQQLPTQTWIRTTRSQFYNPASGKCLDAAGDSTDNGTRVHLWTCHSGSSQRWTTPR